MTERDAGVKTLTSRDIDGLLFAAEMYGLQLDQLSALLGVSAERARSIAGRWRELGFAESARLGPGPMWVWVTRPGLAACGLHYTAVPPALSRLAHIRAVTAVRLALEHTGAANAGSVPATASGSGTTCLTARCTGQTAPRSPGPENAGPSRPN
jgi:hypothetical protein